MKPAQMPTAATGELADYVVVGSGSAGAIVARRLADTGAAVTLIESGRQRRGPLVTVPGLCGAIHTITGPTAVDDLAGLQRPATTYEGPQVASVSQPGTGAAEA